MARLELTDGLSADELAAATALDPLADVDTRGSWRVDGGNQRIAEALASELVTPVRLNTEVLGVDHRGDVVRVATTGGVVEADAAIVALPLAVVRTLPFDPVPPAPTRDVVAAGRNGAQRQAARAGPGSTVGRCRHVGGRPLLVLDGDRRDRVGAARPPLLRRLPGGPRSARRLRRSVDMGPGAAALRPELSLDVDRAVVTTWNDDRFAGESYSARDRAGPPRGRRAPRPGLRPGGLRR